MLLNHVNSIALAIVCPERRLECERLYEQYQAVYQSLVES